MKILPLRFFKTSKMHKITFLLLMTFLSLSLSGQDTMKVFFEKDIDTLYTDTKKEYTHSFRIIVPKQDKFRDAIIEFFVEKNDMSPSGIFLPDERTVKVGSSEDTIRKEFNVKFNRHEKDDRIVLLKLKATDKNGKAIPVYNENNSYRIYIKPLSKDTLEDAQKNGYEFWLFTGTNIDLLDGVKLKELYFKGSYLINFKNNDRFTRYWMHLTFGKNRFFSDRDSLSRISFNDIVMSPSSQDSITIARGYYNSFRQTVTDNIFSSVDILYNIEEWSSQRSKLFLNAGFYIGLQTLRTTYENHSVIADTLTYERVPDSIYRFRPLAQESKIREFNYNLGIGFTHILSTDKINVKTHFSTGLNAFTYPYARRTEGISESVFYQNRRMLFVQLRAEATVLNPGISIGFETFIREGQIPLFNISLTKVLDITQLSSLFGTVQSIQ